MPGTDSTSGAPAASRATGPGDGTGGARYAAPATRGGRTALWVDDRVGMARFARTMLNKIFPDHWSFLLGEIALYSFIILVLTGIYLTFFFIPGTATVVYHGRYAPLRGSTMSQAYASTLHITFGVRAGLLMRQMHHWAAIIFIGAIVAHMARIFFTGGYRKPRELNWMIGVTLMILSIVNGFAGYSLPDDLLSGTGLRIAYSILLSIPVVGTYLAFLIFGGKYPASDIIFRLFIVHVLILPMIIAALIGVHLAMLIRQKHTQFAGKGAREDNVVGHPVWPTYAAKSGGFFFLTTGVIALLGGVAQINPVWMYGPYLAYKVSAATQPDWYIGWLDGALRLMPNLQISGFGYTIPNAFFAGVLLPGLTFGLLYAWPFLENHFLKDNKYHHILESPRDRPVRTAIGAGAFAFYGVCLLAGANDVLANLMHVSLNGLLVTLRVLSLVLPVVVGWIAYRLSKELSAASGGRRKRAAVLVRTPEGSFHEVFTELRPEDTRQELEPEPLPGEEEAFEEAGISADGSANGAARAERAGVAGQPGGEG
ncbi:MAG: cytochrome bc1 complex cytochrome b subunit [Acidimicrobiales bacterium]